MNNTYDSNPHLFYTYPYACDKSIKLTLPTSMLDELSLVAADEKQTRLNVVRQILDQFLRNREPLFS